MYYIEEKGSLYCIFEHDKTVALIKNITDEQLAKSIKMQLEKAYEKGARSGREGIFDYFFPY